MNYNGHEGPRRKFKHCRANRPMGKREQVRLLDFGAGTLHLTD